MQQSDAELVYRAREGDRDAFRVLVERYERLVLNIIYHYLGRSNDCEDLAQEVFLRFFQNLDRYDTARPLKNWLGKIAANRCLDELRKRRSNPVRPLAELDSAEDVDLAELLNLSTGNSRLTSEESEKCLRLLQQAMQVLSEKDRMAFVLREMENLEFGEIANILDTSAVAIRIRLSRTRQKLESELRRMFDEQF